MRFIKHKLRSASTSGGGVVTANKLLGIDGASAFGRSSVSRAQRQSFYEGEETPGAMNMIRNSLGEVAKRPAYKSISDKPYSRNLRGVFDFKNAGKENYFFLYDDCFIVTDENYKHLQSYALPCDLTDSNMFRINQYIFLLSGKCMYIFDTKKNKPIYITDGQDTSIVTSSHTYLPTVYIGGLPSGKAASYEAVNMLNPFIAEQYIGDGSSKTFNTHFEIDKLQGAYIKNKSGGWDWILIDSNTSNSVTLEKAPSAPSVSGEDNVRIIYARKGYLDAFKKLAGCTCATLFGVSGFEDRVFLSGNDNYPGEVFYSEMDKPLYFPDLNYIKVGSPGTKVCALAGQGTELAVICNDYIYTVKGSAVTDDTKTPYVENAVFSITGILKTPPPVNHPPCIFDNEINYLTTEGVCAVTATGVLDERCCQIRSSFINYYLQKENLSNCKMMVYGDFLIISNRKGRIYLLDGKQFSANEDKPFSHRQYEGYIWDDVVAKYMWMQNGRLFFSDGVDFYYFDENFIQNGIYSDEIRIDDFTVDYRPVKAYWETPEITCSRFELIKFFMRMGVYLKGVYNSYGEPYNTGVKISANFGDNHWRVIKDYDAEKYVFNYGKINYAKFVYRPHPKDYSVYCRLLHKKGRSIKLRFENDKDEPMILRGYDIEYIQM